MHRHPFGPGSRSDIPERLIATNHITTAGLRLAGGAGIEIPLRHLARPELGFFDIYAGAGVCLSGLFFSRRGNPLYFFHSLTGGDNDVAFAESGRINQHRVFTQQAPGRPARLNNEIQIGFEHRIVCRHDNAGIAAVVDFDIELNAGEEKRSIQTEALKIFARSKAYFYLILVQRPCVEQINTGVERFIQIRF